MALKARDLMQTSLITVGPDDPLSNVQRLFFEEEINGAPVVTDDLRVVGVITSKDLLRAAAEEHDSARGDPGYFRELFEQAGPDWETAPEGFIDRLRESTVGDFMTEGIVSVSPDAEVPEIARTLRRHHVHRVLVVDEGRLAGLVSSFDLVGLLEKEG